MVLYSVLYLKLGIMSSFLRNIEYIMLKIRLLIEKVIDFLLKSRAERKKNCFFASANINIGLV